MEDYKEKYLEELLRSRTVESQALQLRAALVEIETEKIKQDLADYKAEKENVEN